MLCRMRVLVVCVGLVAACLALNDDEVALFRSYGKVTITTEGTNYRLKSNGYPDHTVTTTGPGAPLEQDVDQTIPQNPTAADESGCLPMGAIGMAINGVAIYNPYSLELAPALDCESVDGCKGHPAPHNKEYHYHGDPVCINRNASGLVGVAYDGFPIYREYNSDLSLPTTANAGLDCCHGKTVGGEYRYYITSDYPWILGCYKGTTTLTIGPNTQCYKVGEIQTNGCNDGTAVEDTCESSSSTSSSGGSSGGSSGSSGNTAGSGKSKGKNKGKGRKRMLSLLKRLLDAYAKK